ncbi:MAG: leucine-rich repeat domain-containing protein [Lactobacillales bacterium]|jgi:hypothetical protein|nr:leucine-rich repeat domain-containing protein [Lactobacillales bacterium]
MVGVASILCNLSASSVSAEIIGTNVVESTEIMLQSFEGKGNVDEYYILSALNLQDAHMYLKSDIVQNFRYLDGNKELISFDKTLKRLPNQDAGKGSPNFMRNLFPSSDGTLNVLGGYEYCFTKDIQPTPESIAQIASICHKYRKNVNFKNLVDSCLNQAFYQPTIERLKTLKTEKEEKEIYTFENEDLKKKFKQDEVQIIEEIKKNITNFQKLNFENQIKKIKGELFKKDKKLLNKLVNYLPRFSNLKTILNKEKAIKNTLIEQALLEKVIEENSEENHISQLQRIIHFGETYSGYDISSISKKLISQLKEMGLLLDETTNNDKRNKTILHLVINMLYMIKNQEQESVEDTDRFLPKYTAEKMLMAYFIKKFEDADIPKFYNKASELIKTNSIKNEEITNKINAEKQRISVANDIIDETNVCTKKNPYIQDLPKHSNAKPLIVNGNLCHFANSSFINCADTGARHLLNLLAYSKARNWNIFQCTNDKDIEELKSALCKIQQGVNNPTKNFEHLPFKKRLQLFYYYQDNGRLINRTDDEYTSIWNYVISNMDKPETDEMYPLLYKQKTNELKSGLLNSLKFIYNVAYAFKEELKINPASLNEAKENLDKLIEEAKQKRVYCTKLKDCTKSVYGLINNKLEIETTDQFSVYDFEIEKEITGKINIKTKTIYPFSIEFSQSHTVAAIEIPFIDIASQQTYEGLNRIFFNKKCSEDQRENIEEITFPSIYSGLVTTDFIEEPSPHLKKYNYLSKFINISTIPTYWEIQTILEISKNNDESFRFIKDKKSISSNDWLKELLKKLYQTNFEHFLELFECSANDKQMVNPFLEIAESNKTNIETWTLKEGWLNNETTSTEYTVFLKPKNIVFENEAFKNSRIQTINFPDSAETLQIDNSVFEGCENLKNLKFPSKLKTLKIKANAFTNCTELETIQWPENATIEIDYTDCYQDTISNFIKLIKEVTHTEINK